MNAFTEAILFLSLSILTSSIWTLGSIPAAARVTTSNGIVQGFTKRLNSVNLNVYYGIPYGEPPVNELRFQKPKPLSGNWTGIYDATKRCKACVQFNVGQPSIDEEWMRPKDLQSEDCLYLNLWTPARANNLDVLVWIHGGAFSKGYSLLDPYDGSYFSSLHGVVFVSLNYRLGPLGFLYLGEEAEAPGNLGLYDQALAFDWIRRNIAAFGGNPDSVTIVGQSSGAVSVSCHLLSPLSKEKFLRAVMYSGSVFTPRSMRDAGSALDVSKEFVNQTDCGRSHLMTDKTKTLRCLQRLSLEKIKRSNLNVVRHINDGKFAFGPTVDGHFLPRDVRQMILGGDVKRSGGILLGITKDEGSVYAPNLFPNYFNITDESLLTENQTGEILQVVCNNRGLSSLGCDVLKMLYTNWKRPSSDTAANRDGVVDLLSDLRMRCPTNLYAQLMSSVGAQIYYSEFAHITQDRNFLNWIGSYHTEDIFYFLGQTFAMRSNFTDVERQLSSQMMNSIVNFMKSGKPVEDNSWLPYTDTNPYVYFYKIGKSNIRFGPRSEQCYFWNNMAEKFKQKAC